MIEKNEDLDDSDFLFEVFENLAGRYTGKSDQKRGIILTLTQDQQRFYALFLLEMEVNNGGFNQYYYNHGDEFADLAVDGFEAIGAKKFAALVSSANKMYREQRDKTSDRQGGSLQGFSDSYKDNPLNELDNEFYNLYQVESLTTLTAKYVRENRSNFIE